MTIGKLLISTVDFKHSNETCLVHQDNYQKIISSNEVLNCHTSLDDMAHDDVMNDIFLDADNIELINLSEDSSSDFYHYGVMIDMLCKIKHKVKGLDWIKKISYNSFNKVIDRTVEQPVLWIAGCSVSAGDGVAIDERFGQLLSSELNLPEYNIAKSGASISCATDQLLRADINAGDKVILGLTNFARMDFSESWKYKSRTIADYIQLHYKKDKNLLVTEYTDYEWLIVKYIHSINQVINYCNKIRAELYLVNLLGCSWVHAVFESHDKYIDLSPMMERDYSRPKYLDYGTDKLHPGPKQHKQYAENILNLITQVKHGKTI